MTDGLWRTGCCMKSLRKNKIAFIYLAAASLPVLALVSGILVGASGYALPDMLSAVFRGELDAPEARVLLYVRLPRVLAGLLCGMALSVAGAVTQGVLANGLASPSIIGVNSGAALAVTLCAAFGVIGGWRLALFSALGAFLAVTLVSIGAKRWGASRGVVVLMGVALNALLGAASDAVIAFFPDAALISRDFMLGDLSSVTYARLIPASAAILIAFALLMTLSCELDLLSLGDESARGLGLNTGAVRAVLLLLAALLAGSAVSVCGLISFVGLLVPHAVRRTAGSLSRHLLPLSALVGAGLVSLSDTLARVILSPYELPVGVIMAFIGAPVFVFILIKGRRGETLD